MVNDTIQSTCLKLFACCVPVKGASRCIICDVQRGTFAYIPLGLFEILTECVDVHISEIYDRYKHVDPEIIDEYIDWLLQKEFAFLTSEPQNFPALSVDYHTPEIINNCIIDIDGNSRHDFDKIFKSLDNLACRYVQLRCFISVPFVDLDKILRSVKNLRFRYIEIVNRFDDSFSVNECMELSFNYPMISRIIFHSSPRKEINSENGLVDIIYVDEKIESEHCCGNISIENFSVNYETFLESRVANSCLNKKISIDRMGNIKNCPSMTRSYGNVLDNSIENVAHTKDFQKIWSITKDQINVCKDCEFRYICTDCRAFHADDDSLEKPFKCRYNPYEGKWEN